MRDESGIKNDIAYSSIDDTHFQTFKKLLEIVAFYVACALFYSYVEGWSILDCVYFVTVTISTVGYGDYTPTSDVSRLVTIVVILIGLVFIFNMVSDFAKGVLSYANEAALKIAKANPEKNVDLAEDEYKYVKKRFYCVATIVVVVLMSSVFLSLTEHWTFVEALYFSIATTTSVGYGDIKISNFSSKVFLILYIPLSVVVVAGAMGQYVSINMEIEAEEKRIEMLARKLDFSMLKELDASGDSGVDRVEFLVAMLVQSGKVNLEEDIDPWLKRFDELDADGSGSLDKDDIEALERAEEQRLNKMGGGLSTKVRSKSMHMRQMMAAANAAEELAAAGGMSSSPDAVVPFDAPTGPPDNPWGAAAPLVSAVSSKVLGKSSKVSSSTTAPPSPMTRGASNRGMLMTQGSVKGSYLGQRRELVKQSSSVSRSVGRQFGREDEGQGGKAAGSPVLRHQYSPGVQAAANGAAWGASASASTGVGASAGPASPPTESHGSDSPLKQSKVSHLWNDENDEELGGGGIDKNGDGGGDYAQRLHLGGPRSGAGAGAGGKYNPF